MVRAGAWEGSHTHSGAFGVWISCPLQRWSIRLFCLLTRCGYEGKVGGWWDLEAVSSQTSRSGAPYSSIYSTLIFQNALLEFNILTYCTLNMACTQHTSGEVGPHPSPDVSPMAIQSQSLHPCQGEPSSSPQEPESSCLVLRLTWSSSVCFVFGLYC